MPGPRERGAKRGQRAGGRGGGRRSAQNAGRTRADPNLLGAPPGGWARSPGTRTCCSAAQVARGLGPCWRRCRWPRPAFCASPAARPPAGPRGFPRLPLLPNSPGLCTVSPTSHGPRPSSLLSFKAQGSWRLLRGMPPPSRSAQAWQARERW